MGQASADRARSDQAKDATTVDGDHCAAMGVGVRPGADGSKSGRLEDSAHGVDEALEIGHVVVRPDGDA